MKPPIHDGVMPDEDALDPHGDRPGGRRGEEESFLATLADNFGQSADESSETGSSADGNRSADYPIQQEPGERSQANGSCLIRRILVVDDEEAYLLLLKQFSRQLGVFCEVAVDAEEALEKLRGSHFDLVVSDIRMKGKDGITLMQEAHREFPHLDFIMMTGYSPDFSYAEIIAAGARDFIAKPFEMRELEAKTRRIERERLVLRRLQQTLAETIEALGSALEMRDPYTAGHQRRVARLACAMAREMGLGASALTAIRMAGLVHDIGKISVPSQILAKPSKLKGTEMGLIREHSDSGYEILKKVHFPWPIADIVRQHHERLDGSGYPQNLVADEIMLEAKVLAIADVVEAMASHRPYRPTLGVAAALEEIENNQGKLYDGRAVQACLRLFRERGYQFE